jgi:hypothetical protein
MLEANDTVNQCEQGVVAANANVVACLELGPALANKVGAAKHCLSVTDLYAQHLRVAITSVARRAYAFFVCHISFSLRENYELIIMNYKLLNSR